MAGNTWRDRACGRQAQCRPAALPPPAGTKHRRQKKDKQGDIPQGIQVVDDIGGYLGLTLETVSRTLNRMKREDIVALPAAVEVVFLKVDVIHGMAGRG